MTTGTRRALLAIGMGAAALRLWGLGYGLPLPASRPDEDLVVGKALKISLGLMPEPRDFNYSHGVYYLEAAALAAFRGVGHLLGRYPTPEAFLDDVTVGHPALHFRICRSLAAILGSLTALLTAWVAWEGYRHRSAALLAGFLVAVNFLHVRDSHFATVDVPMMFFATLALGFSLRAAETRSRRSFVLAGLFAGLATSAKYNAATTAFAIVAAAFPALMRGTPGERRRATASVALAGAVMILAFALTSPYCVLRLGDFLQGVAVQRRELFDGPGVAAWRVHLADTLPGAFGSLGLAFVALGLVRALWLRRPADVVLLAFVATTFGSLARITWVQARYMIPLVPPLAIVAAEAATGILRSGRVRLAVVGLLLAVQPLRSAVAFDRLAARPDTRLLAGDWVDRHIAPESRIAVCRGYGAPAINADDRRPPAFDVVAVPDSIESLREADARYLVAHSHPAIPTTCPSGEALAWLQAHGRPIVAFDPFVNVKGMRRCFNALDAFYLPYCGFEGVERGGPVVTIWDLGERRPDLTVGSRVHVSGSGRGHQPASGRWTRRRSSSSDLGLRPPAVAGQPPRVVFAMVPEVGIEPTRRFRGTGF
jgi:hypothetical protein